MHKYAYLTFSCDRRVPVDGYYKQCIIVYYTFSSEKLYSGHSDPLKLISFYVKFGSFMILSPKFPLMVVNFYVEVFPLFT